MELTPMRFPIRGFTLIELMITIVVIAILASIAIPTYRSYTQRARRSDAKVALMRIQAAQERWFLQNRSYSCDLTAAGLGVGAASENSYYSLAFSACSATAYTARATPTSTGGQNTDGK